MAVSSFHRVSADHSSSTFGALLLLHASKMRSTTTYILFTTMTMCGTQIVAI